MEEDRSLAVACALSVAVAAAAAIGPACGVIERTEPASSDGDETGPHDSPVEVLSIRPDSEAISTTPRLRIAFDAYLEDDAFTTYNTGAFSSGGRGWGGWADWRMIDRTLVWETRGSIPPGLDVKFTLADRLESVTGAPLATSDVLATYRTDDARDTLSDETVSAPDWFEVKQIFEARCDECHGDPSWDVVALERESLVGRQSDQVDRILVKPYDPPDSYLLQKLLWDYPSIRYSPQPPPWSGGEELRRRQLRKIERWIEVGAPE